MDKNLKNDFVLKVKKQIELYEKLKSLVVSENKQLSVKEVKGLDEIVKQKEEIVDSINILEKEKQKIFEKMADLLGFKNSSELKLSDLLTKAGDDDAAEIDRETAVLISLAVEVGKINLGNAMIMKNLVDYGEFISGVIENSKSSEKPLYTPTGITKVKAEQKHTFDQKI